MFRTVIRKDGLNPLTGRLQYRVVECVAVTNSNKVPPACICKRMFIKTSSYHQPNSFVNPRRVAGI